MRRFLPLLAVALVFSACSSDQDIEALEVSRSDYGDGWPLITDDAVLACEPGDITTLTVDGRSYRLNEPSGDAEPPGALRRILTQDPVDGSRGDLSSLARAAEDLCD